MNVDWDRIERWKALVLAEDIEELKTVFSTNGARGPAIRWRPAPVDVSQKALRFPLEFWTKAATDRLPTTRLIDPVELAPALGYLMIVDVVDQGRDFAYRLFGTNVASVSGFDMTRKKLSDHPASPYIREFAMALYRAAIVRREPVWSHYAPAMAVSTAAWERVVLPLTDDDGTICRFLVAAVPIGLDGQPLKA